MSPTTSSHKSVGQTMFGVFATMLTITCNPEKIAPSNLNPLGLRLTEYSEDVITTDELINSICAEVLLR